MEARWTTVSVDGGDMPAYAALPDASEAPGVLVCMHGPGVDRFVTRMCEQLADAGIAALAPDLYYRQDPRPENPMDAVNAMTDAEALADMAAALDALAAEPGVDAARLGVVGFCMGGRLAFLAAANDPGRLAAAVVFYGGRMRVAQGPGPSPFEQLGRIRVPVLGLFGAEDRDPSPADVDAIAAELERAGVPYEFHRYEGAGHAFLRAEAPARYHREAAERAWPTAVDWLRRHLA